MRKEKSMKFVYNLHHFIGAMWIFLLKIMLVVYLWLQKMREWQICWSVLSSFFAFSHVISPLILDNVCAAIFCLILCKTVKHFYNCEVITIIEKLWLDSGWRLSWGPILKCMAECLNCFVIFLFWLLLLCMLSLVLVILVFVAPTFHSFLCPMIPVVYF